MGLLRDRVAIVTGASSGIGRAVARRLAEEGASVLVTARRLDRLEALAEEMAASGGVALPVACDIADEAQIDHVVAATVERFGQIDILANFAQGGMEKHAESFLADTPPQQAVELFVTGPLQCMLFMQKVFPHMKKRGYGRIINVSSHGAYGAPGMMAYGMAKGAVQALTRSASQEWGEFGIVTNTVIPVVLTGSWELSERTRHYVDSMPDMIPVRRLGMPYEDLSPLVAFLASEAAGYINGQVIGIDGGSRLLA